MLQAADLCPGPGPGHTPSSTSEASAYSLGWELEGEHPGYLRAFPVGSFLPQSLSPRNSLRTPTATLRQGVSSGDALKGNDRRGDGPGLAPAPLPSATT